MFTDRNKKNIRKNKNNTGRDNSARIAKWLGILIFPFIIFLLTFNVNSFYGVIDELEWGQYLSSIDSVFQGKIPYKDFMPSIGPLFFWLAGAVFLIFGKTLHTLSVYFYISTVAAYIILYFLGRRLYHWRVFVYILPIVALVETFNPFWSTRWLGYNRCAIGLTGLFLQILYIQKAKRMHLFLSAAVSGLGLLYGIDSGIFLIICGVSLCILMFIYESKGDLKLSIVNFLKRGLIFCFGLIFVITPFIIYLALNKAFLPYIEGTYSITRYHSAMWGHPAPLSFVNSFKHYNSPWSFFISDEFRIYMPIIFYFLVICYTFYAFKRNRNITDCIIAPLISVYGILLYKSGLRAADGPQFDIALLPLLLLFIYFIEKSLIFLIKNIQNLMKLKGVGYLSLAAALAAATISPLYIISSHKRVYGSWSNWLEYIRHKSEILPVYTSLINKGNFKLDKVDVGRIGPILTLEDKARQIEAVTNYIKENTSAGEEVFTFPEQALYNFLSERPALGRFHIALYALTTQRWKEELLSDLELKPPRYIIYSHILSNAAKSIGRNEELFPEVISFIIKNYHIEKSFGQIGIYKRNF